MKLNKNNIISLALLMCAGNSVSAQGNNEMMLSHIPDTFQQVVDEATALESRKAYIHQVTFDIKKFAEDVEQDLNKLKDPEDKMSFAQHIVIFDAKLNTMLASFINPLKAKLAEENDHASTYYKALEEADDILTTLHTQFQKISKVMKNPDNKKTGAKMAKALKEQIDLFFKQHDQLDRKLISLHNYLEQLNLDTLAKEMAAIRVILQEAKTKNIQPLSLTEQAKIANMIHKKIQQK